jgi:hypothetical protein
MFFNLGGPIDTEQKKLQNLDPDTFNKKQEPTIIERIGQDKEDTYVRSHNRFMLLYPAVL